MRTKRSKISATPIVHTEFMNPLELCRYIGFKRRTIYAKLAEGGLPGVKIFGSWRFRKTDIDEWIKQQPTTVRKRRTEWKRKRKSS